MHFRQVERAQYEADLAKRRYMQVDPENRMVADELEAAWNTKLRKLNEAQDEYQKQMAEDRKIIKKEQREAVAALVKDFPKIWNNPKTKMRDRKRMARLLIEDVTLLKTDEIAVHIRFKGGKNKSLFVPNPLQAGELRKTPAAVVKRIDELLEYHYDGEIAEILNKEGLTTGTSLAFNTNLVGSARRRYGLVSFCDRMKKKGLKTEIEMSKLLGVGPETIAAWRRQG